LNLLDVVAITRGTAANPALATVVTPDPISPLDTNHLLYRGTRSGSFVAVNADKVAPQIMLAAERPSTSAVRADVRLQTVGVMGRLVGLEIISAGKG
jgi:hypothetical protein